MTTVAITPVNDTNMFRDGSRNVNTSVLAVEPSTAGLDPNPAVVSGRYRATHQVLRFIGAAGAHQLVKFEHSSEERIHCRSRRLRSCRIISKVRAMLDAGIVVREWTLGGIIQEHSVGGLE